MAGFITTKILKFGTKNLFVSDFVSKPMNQMNFDGNNLNDDLKFNVKNRTLLGTVNRNAP